MGHRLTPCLALWRPRLATIQLFYEHYVPDPTTPAQEIRCASACAKCHVAQFSVVAAVVLIGTVITSLLAAHVAASRSLKTDPYLAVHDGV